MILFNVWKASLLCNAVQHSTCSNHSARSFWGQPYFHEGSENDVSTAQSSVQQDFELFYQKHKKTQLMSTCEYEIL